MKEEHKNRLVEIIEIAHKLNWVLPRTQGQSYPTMQLSEVEKCMLAMVDDFEFKRMKEWKKDVHPFSIASV